MRVCDLRKNITSFDQFVYAWADQFLDDGRIKDSGQGKHMRILHVLTSKKVQQQLRDHLKDMAVLDRLQIIQIKIYTNRMLKLSSLF